MNSKTKDINRFGINKIETHLFTKSLDNQRHNHLWKYVISRRNILCAIKIIKSNPKSNTPGPDKISITDIIKQDIEISIREIKKRLYGRKRCKGREFLIPKTNDDFRPIGIINIYDRIAQQCVKNILEPILEAHFNPESFGFRRGRNAQQCMSMIATSLQFNNEGHIYDCDLKKYFDTVKIDLVLDKLRLNHNIQDDYFLQCIKRLMWIDIVNPQRKYDGIGLRQGTILGPILSNVMFHDFELKLNDINDFKRLNGREIIQNPNIFKNHGKNYKRGREFYFNWLKNRRVVKILRYADDFILISKGKYDIYDAIMMFKDWCKENELEINENKTKLIELNKTTRLEFLGYLFRKTGDTRRGSFIISPKNINQFYRDSRKKLQWSIDNNLPNYFLSYMRGKLEYYNICTNVGIIIGKLYRLLYIMSKRKDYRKKISIITDDLEAGRYYHKICGTTVNMWEMREKSKKSTKDYMLTVHEMWLPTTGEYNIIDWTLEVIKNRDKAISNRNTGNVIYIPSLVKVVKKDPISGVPYLLINPNRIRMHHKIPLHMGGKDLYSNLLLLSDESHKLIHNNIEKNKIPKYINIKNLNKYRQLCGNATI